MAPSELPWKNIDTPQISGRKIEKEYAKKYGARVHPMSGAGSIKGDYSNEEAVFEQKLVTKDHHTHSLNGKKLNELLQDALRNGKEAVYVVHFEEFNLTLEATVRRGK